MAKYDTIGYNYDYRRTADPYLAGRLIDLLGPLQMGTYLDIGCGTGNYTTYLAEHGMNLIGIDPSKRMLDEAKRRSPGIDWRLGHASNTGLDDNLVEGVVATLTIHHWPDLQQGFFEMQRVLKRDGKMVLFTSDPEQMEGYWLNHYFPTMLKDSFNQMPAVAEVREAVEKAGLRVLTEEPYSIKPDLKDHFLYVGKHQPKMYLDPGIRKGISSFSHLANQNEVTKGLVELEKDIESGRIDQIIQSYENQKGDYLFMLFEKSA